ncbi:beta-galactosidase [Opitutus terrae]|uniref:Beta-galactosidase n=1 Tax=Opitutus terrae (strain DSM 11246 / JCM 15787 / PB90-1) TaxID=452637 RepID=B1ZRX0_OPITP|nr:beta-galactosidase [Opitutus terrae]ACB74649.1 Beta-galactosidase [Opitutus terrae PB90-1]
MKLAVLILLVSSSLMAAPLTISLAPRADAPAESAAFAMGTAKNPSGSTLALDSRSLWLDGRRWTPAMGEFHYSRYPAAEWRNELLKMKAGGIDLVATYVFWIHHEEIEGQWDWSGQRDLRRFVKTAGEVGLKVIVRCGPWCHGEVRNGGLPDWIVARGNMRSDDPGYLASATRLYQQIAAQLGGLLWKEGGPVIGIQLENEYGGPAAHLLTLKRIAREAGLDVPIYTRTGWPALRTPMPFGEIIPLYGVYAEGFWDRELTSMPGNYWAGFHFSTLRTDANIANEALGRRDVQDAPDVARYPYLTCEIGGGMMSSYHRRILVDSRDIESTTLVKLGSGSVSPGYYMYHGGTNPEAKLTTLMESQATSLTNWNDLPEKNYDFQAPLGQYGQVRPQYHSLRRLHLFLHEWGDELAATSVSLPDVRPTGRDDVTTLRWAARADGASGFLFVNNYERSRELPPKPDVQFTLVLASGTRVPPADSGRSARLTFPSRPITVAPSAAFFWPFGLDLGGVTLTYATAQPITQIIADGARTVFFAETPGVPAEFAFDARETKVEAVRGEMTRDADRILVAALPAGREVALVLQPRKTPDHTVRIVLLSDADSRALWKGTWHGGERVFLAHDNLSFATDRVRIESTPGTSTAATASVYPAPAAKLRVNGANVASEPDGLFTRFTSRGVQSQITPVAFELVRAPGPLRHIQSARTQQPVAAAPIDADFADAAVWRIQLPRDLDLGTNPLLRLHYVGDVARVSIGGTFVTDDFYNGNALEIGLRRHADLLRAGELTIAILPLQKGAPIFFPESAKPEFEDRPAVAELQHVEVVTRPEVEL